GEPVGWTAHRVRYPVTEDEARRPTSQCRGPRHTSEQMGDAKFKVNDFVRRISNPDMAGVIREVRWDGQGKSWQYRVQFGNALRGVPEEDLQVPPDVSGPWPSVLTGS